jgi:hypothetical protein
MTLSVISVVIYGPVYEYGVERFPIPCDMYLVWYKAVSARTNTYHIVDGKSVVSILIHIIHVTKGVSSSMNRVLWMMV